MSPRTFEARYDGRCPACSGPIEAGDRIGYDDDGHLLCAECLESDRPPMFAPPGALHVHWLEFVYDDDGNPLIDENAEVIVTRAREKPAYATPPGWDESAGTWDAHGWVYRLSFPIRHCVTCRCETTHQETL